VKLDEKTRVLVTGGAGFLGRNIVDALRAKGVEPVVPRRSRYDLRQSQQTRALFSDVRPELVIHNAWTGGGIGFAQRYPASMARDNVLMATHVVDACREFGTSKFVGVGSICAYPKHTATPFREKDLWSGYPEETNAAYGIAKRMMLVLTQAFREEFGLNGVHLLLVNLYGPHDNFDLQSGHVIPAMIRKFIDAKRASADIVTMWGDGSPTREFLYITDAADAIVRAAELYDSSEPVNIGSGQEIAIRALAEKIAALVGYAGSIEWDVSRPNGQPRRVLDVSRARDEFGFSAQVSLDEGLRRTIDWYLASSADR